MRIVVTGSLAYDYLMTFPGRFREHFLSERMHRLTVSFLVDDMRRLRGGVAGNIAWTLALLGDGRSWSPPPARTSPSTGRRWRRPGWTPPG